MNQIIRTVPVFLALVLASGGCGGEGASPPPPPPPPPPDRPAGAEKIAYAYHGLLLDEDLQEIALDPATILLMQTSIIDALAAGGDPGLTRNANLLLDQDLDAASLTAGERMAVNDAVISTLLDGAPDELRERFGWRHQLIRSRAAQHYPRLDAQTTETLKRRGFSESLLQADTVAAAESAYLANCRTESVPVPPDWPDERWVFRGDLDEEDNLIGQGETKVYTYSDADGVCFALPRSESVLMGIICQAEKTGKACFFDNIDASTDKRVDWRTSRVVMAGLRNGTNLGENCTSCHRGKNVFIIHPGSALDVEGLDTDPGARYSPIGQSDWRNPPAMSLPAVGAGQRSCVRCHELAEPTPEYCGILRQAAQRTMPPTGSPAGWPAPGGSPWALHIGFLRSKCPDEEE